MSIDQSELSRLTNNIPAIIIDRALLPYEEFCRWAEGGQEVRFSEEQLDDRIRAVLSLPTLGEVWTAPNSIKHDLLKDDLKRASAWTFASCDNHVCLDEINSYGKRVFGWWFETYPQVNLRTQFAIIAPDSPYINSSLSLESGLCVAMRHVNPDLDVRHEIGHLLFNSYSPSMSESTQYFNEARADGFMAYSHSHDDSNAAATEEVNEWIHRRRLEAFFNIAPSTYWTAAAIDATLNRKRIPNWDDNFYTIRGLQIRVLDTLLAEEKGQANIKSYSTNEARNLYDYQGPLDKKALRVSDEYIPELREQFPAKQIIQTLSAMLDTTNMSAITRTEGVKIIEAFNYFSPENAVLVPLRPKTTQNQNNEHNANMCAS